MNIHVLSHGQHCAVCQQAHGKWRGVSARSCARACAFAFSSSLFSPSPCPCNNPAIQDTPHTPQTFYGKREYKPSGKIEGDYRGYGLSDMRRIRQVVVRYERTQKQ